MNNTLLLYMILPIISILLAVMLWHKKVKRILFWFSLAIVWVAVFSAFLSNTLVDHTQIITFTAQGTHSAQSQGDQILITGFSIDGVSTPLDQVVDGKWVSYEGDPTTHTIHYGWLPGDERQDASITKSISFRIPDGKNREVLFNCYPWSGEVEISTDTWSTTVDTFGNENQISASIADAPTMTMSSMQAAFPHYCVIFLILVAGMFGGLALITRKNSLDKITRYKFLFSQLVNRDFVLKYKRTMLGMLWSMLSPLFNLLIMWLVFGKLLGSNINHYAVYLFTGQIIFGYFSETTNLGMTALLDNAPIFTKVNVPKYMFILSKSVSSLINFAINICILFAFVIGDGVTVKPSWIMLIYPLVLLVAFNIGVSLILSACFVFFRDMQYLWGIACQLLMWLSAIFYSIDTFPPTVRNLFLLNPMYLFIRYVRKILLENTVPSIWFHLLMAAYALVAIGVGFIIYKKKNHEFLYYV